MPCQEPPIAMSTWQAAIHVPKGCRVLMSGNELPVQNSDEADLGMIYACTNVELTFSTGALLLIVIRCFAIYQHNFVLRIQIYILPFAYFCCLYE